MNIEELRSAWSRNTRPVATEANLQGANLRWANLQGADLRWADLRWANLQGADLQGANLRWANLHRANLQGANLRWADLQGADLRWANLQGANLRWADLQGADLHGADLQGAGIYGLGDTPSGVALIFPTCEGWQMQVSCWRGTPDELRAMIAPDSPIDWPEATGAEKDRRRPHLEAVLARVDVITEQHANLIPLLAEKWGK